MSPLNDHKQKSQWRDIVSHHQMIRVCGFETDRNRSSESQSESIGRYVAPSERAAGAASRSRDFSIFPPSR
jgi:hypothetical protein